MRSNRPTQPLKPVTAVVLLVFLGLLLGGGFLLSRRLPDIPKADDATGAPRARTIVDMVARRKGPTGGVPAGAQTGPLDDGGSEVAIPVPSASDRPNEYVLSFFSDRDRQVFIAFAQTHGIEVVASLDLGNSLRIRVPDRAALRAALRDSPWPVDISTNPLLRPPPPPETPGDPLAPDPLGYKPFGSQGSTILGLPADRSRLGEGVTIAVLDTAVGAHPMLNGVDLTSIRLADGGDAAHGTAVASLIAGDDPLVSGVAPAAALVSVAVVGADGLSDAFTVAQGIVAAVGAGAQVISISLGGAGDATVLRQAVAYATEAGAVIVASTGNDALDRVFYPAAYADVTAVAAIDADGAHVYFSNRGDEVDFAAPGLGVAVATADGDIGPFSGTSASAPYVSGAIAALLSLRPDLSPTEAVALLEQTANDVSAPGHDEFTGAGVPDVERALEREEAGVYDIALGRPFLKDMGDQVAITVYAQNRGTETIGRVLLNVRLDGAPHELPFYDVAPGRTISREFLLPSSMFENGGRVDLVVDLLTPGVTDRAPADNSFRAWLAFEPSK